MDGTVIALDTSQRGWDSESSDMGKRHLPDLIKEYQQLVAEVARLQAEVDRERSAALAALPATYGFPDMDSFIKAVVHACRKPRRQKAEPAHRAKSKRSTTSPAVGRGLAQATKPSATPVEPPLPAGTSLDDAKNFGLMPNLALLHATTGDTRPHQAKLSEALKFAQQVLHTSGVPAAVWREWRQFERNASDVLRTLNTSVRIAEE